MQTVNRDLINEIILMFLHICVATRSVEPKKNPLVAPYIKQARKLQDAQAEKLTCYQIDKMTG